MQGLVDDDLGKHLEGVTAEARVEAINKLLAVHRLSLSRTADGSTFYIGITAEEAQKYVLTRSQEFLLSAWASLNQIMTCRFKGFTQDDHLVYQSIKGAGNTGNGGEDTVNHQAVEADPQKLTRSVSFCVQASGSRISDTRRVCSSSSR